MGKCKNCGHEVWYRFEGLMHKYSNNLKCTGDGKNIINCPCTNPEPIQEVSLNSSHK